MGSRTLEPPTERGGGIGSGWGDRVRMGGYDIGTSVGKGWGKGPGQGKGQGQGKGLGTSEGKG